MDDDGDDREIDGDDEDGDVVFLFCLMLTAQVDYTGSSYRHSNPVIRFTRTLACT